MDNLKVNRPWGSYTVIFEKKGDFKVKLVEVLPNQSLSLQKHKFRSEHWVVLNGKAKVTVLDKIYYLVINEYIFIPKGSIHRLENTGSEILKIIEIQRGEYLGEDDIERLDDVYGRIFNKGEKWIYW